MFKSLQNFDIHNYDDVCRAGPLPGKFTSSLQRGSVRRIRRKAAGKTGKPNERKGFPELRRCC